MNSEQPSKIGKIGYLIAYMGQFILILPLVDILSHSAGLLDVLAFISSALVIGCGYFLAARDVHMARLGWKLVFKDPLVTWRDRFARGFIYFGSFYTISTATLDRTLGPTSLSWSIYWILRFGAVALWIVGWTIILTEREGPPLQEAKDDTPTI
jgi:membrane-associated protease RseP (regulator of RpoE activity)